MTPALFWTRCLLRGLRLHPVTDRAAVVGVARRHAAQHARHARRRGTARRLPGSRVTAAARAAAGGLA